MLNTFIDPDAIALQIVTADGQSLASAASCPEQKDEERLPGFRHAFQELIELLGRPNRTLFFFCAGQLVGCHDCRTVRQLVDSLGV